MRKMFNDDHPDGTVEYQLTMPPDPTPPCYRKAQAQ